MNFWLEDYPHTVNQPIAQTMRDAISEYIERRKSLDTSEIIKITVVSGKTKTLMVLSIQTNCKLNGISVKIWLPLIKVSIKEKEDKIFVSVPQWLHEKKFV